MLDFLCCSHNGVGGASTLTLAAARGFPQPTDAFGTSGTLLLPYQIAEYTDSTLAQLVRGEAGVGSLNLATNVLTRLQVFRTWVAGTGYTRGGASPLTFGTNAANIAITFGGGANMQKGALAGTLNNIGGTGSDVWQPFNTRCTYDGNTGTMALSAGQRLYSPFEYVGGKPMTQVAVDVATAGAAGSLLRMGVMDIDPGGGGALNLLIEFTSSAQIDVTATGFRAVTLATPWWMPPGFYYLVLQPNAAVTLRRMTHFGHGLLSTASGGGRDILMFDKSTTYGPLPATGDTAPSGGYSRSSGGQVMGLFK
jgi:hypothetical protein